MFSDRLFEKVLLDPSAETPGGRLLIVSGFATASMADRHMSKLQEAGRNIAISLIVGMARRGIEEAQHSAFMGLAQKQPYGLDFDCRYAYQGNLIHAKTYLWIDAKGTYTKAFCGSANYTITGFGRGQIESMAPANPDSVNAFYSRLHRISASCLEGTIADVIPIVRPAEPSENDESVVLPLIIQGTGQTHERAGLNWGQRPGRNRDQAYIPIPKNIRESDFFPPHGEQFTALTDDGFSFIFVRAQSESKALHTTRDNSEIGRYIRHRIGVPLGTFITRKHLVDYGRLDIRFTKIDNETYLMDFRPNLEQGVAP